MSIGKTNRGVVSKLLKLLKITFTPLLSRFLPIKDSGTLNNEPNTINTPNSVKMTKPFAKQQNLKLSP